MELFSFYKIRESREYTLIFSREDSRNRGQRSNSWPWATGYVRSCGWDHPQRGRRALRYPRASSPSPRPLPCRLPSYPHPRCSARRRDWLPCNGGAGARGGRAGRTRPRGRGDPGRVRAPAGARGPQAAARGAGQGAFSGTGCCGTPARQATEVSITDPPQRACSAARARGQTLTRARSPRTCGSDISRGSITRNHSGGT